MHACKRLTRYGVLLLYVSSVVLSSILLNVYQVTAEQLKNRSIIIPTALVNATTSHQFRFDYMSASSVGSVLFEYCDNTPLFNEACVAPTGLDVSNANLASQFGQTGFSIGSTTANSVVITRPALSVVPGPAGYTFGNMVNASTPNHTVFVRISTYGSNDATGSSIDEGSVAFTLAPSLAVNAFVPPFLALCTGVTVALNCSSANGLGINLGILSPSQTSSGTTQVAAATNDPSGYTLFLNGTTLTSGNNFIQPPATPTISSPGTSQFGLNLRANTVPAAGHEPEGNGTAAPTANYNQPNLFAFKSGDAIVTAGISTDFNRFTTTYMTNIPFGQRAGVYSTTLTYTAVASF